MKKLSVSLGEEHVDMLDERADAGEAGSRSEALRQYLDEIEALREERDELRQELEATKNEKRVLVDQREENTELRRYVEDQRSADERWRQAGLATKLKWQVLGMPDDDDSDE